jgi:hypothetical protein
MQTGGDAGLPGSFKTAVPASGGTIGNCCGGNGGFGGAGDFRPDGGTHGNSQSGNVSSGGGGGGSRGRIRFDTPAPTPSTCRIIESVISPSTDLEGSNTSCSFL